MPSMVRGDLSNDRAGLDGLLYMLYKAGSALEQLGSRRRPGRPPAKELTLEGGQLGPVQRQARPEDAQDLAHERIQAASAPLQPHDARWYDEGQHRLPAMAGWSRAAPRPVPDVRTSLLPRRDRGLELPGLVARDGDERGRQLGQPRHVETVAPLRRALHELVQERHVFFGAGATAVRCAPRRLGRNPPLSPRARVRRGEPGPRGKPARPAQALPSTGASVTKDM